MRRWMILVVLAISSCFAPYHAETSPPDAARGIVEWIYPLPVTRMLEKSLETIESLEGWTLTHLDPAGGIIECERESWWYKEHIEFEFVERSPGTTAFYFKIDGEGLNVFPIDPDEAIREFLAALENCIEAP